MQYFAKTRLVILVLKPERIGNEDATLTLRKAGNSLVMTIPRVFIEQNRLNEGSQVEVLITGKGMTIKATPCPRYRLADLMAEIPNGFPRVEGWDEMPPISSSQ